MKNPNEYDDEVFASASADLDGTVAEMWDAGGTEDDIRAVFENSLKNAMAS